MIKRSHNFILLLLRQATASENHLW